MSRSGARVLTDETGHHIAESTVAEPESDLVNGPASGMAIQLGLVQTILHSLCNHLAVRRARTARTLGRRRRDSICPAVSSHGRAGNRRILVDVHVADAVGQGIGAKFSIRAIHMTVGVVAVVEVAIVVVVERLGLDCGGRVG